MWYKPILKTGSNDNDKTRNGASRSKSSTWAALTTDVLEDESGWVLSCIPMVRAGRGSKGLLQASASGGDQTTRGASLQSFVPTRSFIDPQGEQKHRRGAQTSNRAGLTVSHSCSLSIVLC